jgi:hypothetical protein
MAVNWLALSARPFATWPGVRPECRQGQAKMAAPVRAGQREAKAFAPVDDSALFG